MKWEPGSRPRFCQRRQIAPLPQLPGAWKGQNLSTWVLSRWQRTLHDLFTADYTNTHTELCGRCTASAGSQSVTLCPIEFAGPAAGHNKVFTPGHLGGREWLGRGRCEGRQWMWHGERKRHSVIMYELSKALWGGGENAAVHLKRRLSCQDTVIPLQTLVVIECGCCVCVDPMHYKKAWGLFFSYITHMWAYSPVK